MSLDTVEDSTFKILVATDIHLGYAEKDAIKGKDSFNTFEEILQLAVENDVDFILLGGDLFHDSKPSPYCVYKCSSLLRKYTLGDKPISVEFLSDQSYNFQHLSNPVVNYEDPNINVAIPVFSIHGNHDDPTGKESISALDVLASTGLINYFGRCEDLKEIELSPILLQKGQSRLALYGLSHIRDERLGRLFREGKVLLERMPEDENWFTVLVLHQNRSPRGPKNYIPESMIPDFVKLVIWGHEHDCRIIPEEVGDVYISQPGSSVATSLSSGESIEKKIGLLKINGSRMKMIPIPLKTVRPFIYDEIILAKPETLDFTHAEPAEYVEKTLKLKVDEMISLGNEKATENGYPGMLPLIRLITHYHVERQAINVIKFGQKFAQRVANPEDMIVLKPFKVREKTVKAEKVELDEVFDDEEQWTDKVEDLVTKYYETNVKKTPVVLSVKGLTEAVSRFITKKDTDAIECILKHQKKKTIEKLCELNPDIENAKELLQDLKKTRQLASEKEGEIVDIQWDKAKAEYMNVNPGTSNRNGNTITIEDSDSEESPRPTRGRGSRGGRGSRSRGRRAGKI